MARLVMKFGGTSVGDVEKIKNVAQHIKREVDEGNEIAVVVSAMAGRTNTLVDWCNKISQEFDEREYDTVVASGEQVSSGLLTMALQAIGVNARSWQGWQIPIQTNQEHGSARIDEIDGQLLIDRIQKQKQVAVCAGFQGVTTENRIATLGRNGSDTSAVAIAAAVNADRCDIYTDVDGIYTTDPRIEQKARRLKRISYEGMLEVSSMGAEVLQVRSVELAMNRGVRVLVRSSFENPDGLIEAEDETTLGTIVCNEEEVMEKQVVTAIAFSRDEAKISIRQVVDKPGVAAAIFGPLAEANINVDMIIQTISSDGRSTDITFTLPATDLDQALKVLKSTLDKSEYMSIEGDADVVKISIIGAGMRTHPGVAAAAFKALAERNINILAIATSEIKISVLVEDVYTELAVRVLHSAYNLDQE